MSHLLLKIGARDSHLSIIQTQNALARLKKEFPKIDWEFSSFSSPGDQNQQLDLRESPPDFFTRDLDQAILNGQLDAAIHSAKDLPNPIPEGLDWFWLPWREDPRDVLVLANGKTLQELPPNPVIGISSERRDLYCKKHFPQAIFKSIRGTIERRLAQLDAGDYDLLIMAAAALHRLQLSERISAYIAPTELPPPEGQGYLAITFRQDDQRFLTLRQYFTKCVTLAGGGIGEQATSLAVINALKQADVCLYDDLLDASVLQFCPKTALLISVGKRAGAHRLKQDEITNLLIDYVRQGKRVARLKGGDPGIFGRLTEETDALSQRQLAFRVLPGIPTLCTATTGTGYLLTRRAESRGFCVMTPNPSGEKPEILPQAITKEPLVLFMAIGKAQAICQELVEQYPLDTPVKAVFNAGMVDEFLLTGTLSSLPTLILEHFGTYIAEKSPPGILIMGNCQAAPWPALGALAKQKVWLTGSETIQTKGVAAVTDFGGKAICQPLIQLIPCLEDVSLCDKMAKSDALIISSPASARAFLAFIQQWQVDVRKIPEIISCGPGTTAELERFNLFPTIAPKTNFSSEGICQAISNALPVGAKLLRLRNERAGSTLAKALQDKGYQVQEHLIYQNRSIILEKMPICDVIFFASSSAVMTAVEQFGIEALRSKQLLAIGQPTATAILKAGLPPPWVSPQATTQDAITYLAKIKTMERLSSDNNL